MSELPSSRDLDLFLSRHSAHPVYTLKYEEPLMDAENSVRLGRPFAQPLAQHDVFPPMVTQMVAVGEDSGALDQMLESIAEFYDREVETAADQLTSMIEPLLIVFVGGIIGSMVVALYLPIFTMVTAIQGSM